MKKVYVCGDSFCVSDLEYGECWVDLLGKDRDVTSLAQVSATNTLISMQVDQAIAENAEFIIVQGTSCTRGKNDTMVNYIRLAITQQAKLQPRLIVSVYN